MASESSRSSNGADSRLVSLITISESRYEGILQHTDDSTITLKNVHSFGTEGRKKDGPHVPPSNKVYDYIRFCGRDIKDLQVKASPPAQSPQPIHIDPSIIQSQYSCTPSMSTSLPSAGSGPVADPRSHAAQRAILKSTLEGGYPLYQPGGSLGSLGSSTPRNADGSGLSVPMPWHGFYPLLNSQAQQPFLKPTPGFSMPYSMQQPVYPGISSPLPNLLGFYIPVSNLREFTPPLLPPFSTGTGNLISMTPQSTLPPQSAVLASEYLPSLMPNMVSSAVPATASLSDTLPSVSQSITSILETNPITVPVTMPKAAPILSLPYQTTPHHVSPNVGTVKSNHNETSTPPLVTPRQLLQPNLSTLASSLSSDPAKKDIKVVQATSSKPPASGPVTTQAPVLPLPPPPNHKLNGPPFHALHNQTSRGSELGRGNGRSFILSGNDREHERGREDGKISFIPSGNDRGRGRGMGNEMELLLKTEAGRTYSIEVEAENTVEGLRLKLRREYGSTFEDKFIVVFGSQKLDEGRSLGSYKIQNGSVLNIIFAESFPSMHEGFLVRVNSLKNEVRNYSARISSFNRTVEGRKEIYLAIRESQQYISSEISKLHLRCWEANRHGLREFDDLQNKYRDDSSTFEIILNSLYNPEVSVCNDITPLFFKRVEHIHHKLGMTRDLVRKLEMGRSAGIEKSIKRILDEADEAITFLITVLGIADKARLNAILRLKREHSSIKERINISLILSVGDSSRKRQKYVVELPQWASWRSASEDFDKAPRVADTRPSVCGVHVLNTVMDALNFAAVHLRFFAIINPVESFSSLMGPMSSISTAVNLPMCLTRNSRVVDILLAFSKSEGHCFFLNGTIISYSHFYLQRHLDENVEVVHLNEIDLIDFLREADASGSW